ncbi:hypothetical protein HALLA_16180 [Halostagnicola larsenii XH-48]|uniref:Uncharacterized protein n=1 Tax=Halostagnicola larsenii XH-48 TaxID=797299 RepID=W0JUZ7_9EURY|nr:hypothetical protein [Halostagnicola larsenii]AHG01090.1 hypothetical protein HALLA_16180 [Halostagnicola larsenii XH-48]
MPRRISRANVLDAVLGELRRIVLSVRGRFFSRPKPLEPSALVSLGEHEAQRVLGERHFEPNWDMSFAHFGEVLNLRRVEYVTDHPTGYEWWQIHVRGYHHPQGLELTAHFETDPSETPDAHVDRIGIDIDRGLEELIGVLEKADVSYRRLSKAEVAGLS